MFIELFLSFMPINFSQLSSLCNRFFPLFFTFFALFPQNLFSQDPVKIFIYAGQSNSQGRSTSLASIPTGEEDANILFAWNIQAASNYLAEGWDTLQPVLRRGSQTTAIHAGELAVGRNLYGEGLENIGIIKVAKSGTNLKVPWNPTFPRTSSTSGTGNGGMYWLMINFVESKLADLEARGIPYEIEAIFWHQGEADTRSNLAPDYEVHFQQFVDSVQAHLDPDIEVYAVSVYNPSRRVEDVATVRAAQEAVADRNEHVHFIDLDSIYFDSTGQRNDAYITSDGVHYKTPGYFKVGDAFTTAYLANNPLFPCDTTIQVDSLSRISITSQATSDCRAQDGSIWLGGGPDSVWYSIDGGSTFQDTPIFRGLAAGSYTILVQDIEGVGCKIPLPGTPIQVASPPVPQILNVNSFPTSQCEAADGGLVVQALADTPEFSLDGVSFQAQAQFENLTAGNYWVYVREQASPTCLDSVQTQVSRPSFCGPPECDVQRNLALNGEASQSSTRGNGFARFAVDGDTVGDDNWGDEANLQHTETEVGAWWQVDLQGLYALDTLVMYNRLSTSSFILRRLADFYVFVSASEMDGESSIEELINDPTVVDTLIEEAVGRKMRIPLGHVEGQYVLIKLRGEGPLHMSEVEVYGCEANPIVCEVSIDEVSLSEVSGCDTEDGSISISASGAHLEYSIDQGQSFYPSPIFSNLSSGAYHIVVRDSLQPGCAASYGDNPISLSSPADSIQIEAVLVQAGNGCDSTKGRIEVMANGITYEYSIDGGNSFFPQPVFEDLESGNYELVVRDSRIPSCEKVYDQNPIHIHLPSQPEIVDVLAQDITDCGLVDGQLSILALGDSLAYSIDGGLSFQATPIFSGLDSGAYHILVQEISHENCKQVYEENPVRIKAPESPELIEIQVSDVSECGVQDGQIEVLATGNSLVYSIDRGVSFQESPIFSNLDAGPYQIQVREAEFLACLAESSSQTFVNAPPDCESCSPENLSLRTGVTASQSTTRGNGFAHFVIDGNPLGNNNWGSDANMQHTETAPNTWWKVDLGEVATLDSIVIFNRTTTQTFILRRLRDFHVYISSTDIDGSRSLTDLSSDPLLFEYEFPGEAGPIEQLHLPQVQGRFVLIKLTGEGPLHMAEVEVWGCSGNSVNSSSFGQTQVPSKPIAALSVSLHASPNPFQKSFELEVRGSLPEGAYLKILNSMGQVLYQAPARQTQSIELNDSEREGFYLVLIESVSGIRSIKVAKAPQEGK